MGVLAEEYRYLNEGLRYGFAVGKVRVLETRLVDRAMLERLIDAPSLTEQKRVLAETPYGPFLDDAVTVSDIERAIDEALDSAYAFLDAAGLPEPVVRFFRLRFDFANLRAALKARLVGAPLEGLLQAHGSIPPSAFTRDIEKLPAPFGPIATEWSAEETRDEPDLLALDAAIDKALFSALVDAARQARSPFLVSVARVIVDTANMKTVARAVALSMPPVRVEALLIDGGTVPVRELARICRMSRDEALAALESRLGLGAGTLSAGSGSSDLDLVADEVLIRAVRRDRRPEPGADDVIAYVLAREAEAQLVRVALIGRMTGLDSVALHRRMRATFR